MTKKVYSKEELQKIWERIKPKEIGKERLRIDALENDVKRVGSYLDILIRQIDSINSRLDKLEGLEEKGVEELELVKVSEDEAMKQISEYIEKHPGCRTSDIIFDLHLDPDLVLKVLRRLEKKGKIKGKDVE